MTNYNVHKVHDDFINAAFILPSTQCLNFYGAAFCSRGLDEGKARWFFQQLVLALDYCHKMNISNRDIKLENTLLHSQGADRRPMVKLCDFGRPQTLLYTVPPYAETLTLPEYLLSQCALEGLHQ